MSTLKELMAEVLGPATTGQEKTASAAKPSSAEVDQVMANLGLQSSEAVKTAAAVGPKNGGGNMSLADFYEGIMGSSETATSEQEKTAAAASAPGDSEESTAFGEIVGDYFNEIVEPYFEKISADLETEAGKNEEQPLQHLTTGGSMTSALGTPKDPHLQVNHSASSGAPLRVAVQNSTPYALREAALKKTILKRTAVAPVGNIVD